MYYLYLVKSETLYSSDIGSYQSFALCCYLRGPFTKELIVSISDVSIDEIFVQSIAASFTDEQLEPVHIIDAICNLLP